MAVKAAEMRIPPWGVFLTGLRPPGGVVDDFIDALCDKGRKGEAVGSQQGGPGTPGERMVSAKLDQSHLENRRRGM